jgi:holin
MTELQQFISPMIVGLCWLIGNTLKSSVPKLPNNYIPLALGLIGAILMTVLNGFSGLNLIIGVVSGLSATGVHQVYKGIKDDKKEETHNEMRYPGDK